jgi:hypothetical protein
MGFDFSSPLWAWREVKMALKYKQLHGHLNVMNDFVVPSDDSDGRRGGALGWMVSNIRDKVLTNSTRLSCWRWATLLRKSWSRLKEALLLYKS